MKQIAIIIILGFLFFSFDHKNIKGRDVVVLDSLMSEKLKIAIIDDTAYSKTPWNPTYKQLELIDAIVYKASKSRKGVLYKHLSPDSIQNYYRQYVFKVDSNGDLLAYVNAICEVHEFWNRGVDGKMYKKRSDWQHEIIRMLDGGDCYWHALINLTTKKCLNFGVNGLG